MTSPIDPNKYTGQCPPVSGTTQVVPSINNVDSCGDNSSLLAAISALESRLNRLESEYKAADIVVADNSTALFNSIDLDEFASFSFLTANYFTSATTSSAIASAVSTLESQVISAGYVSTATLVDSYFTKAEVGSAISEALLNIDAEVNIDGLVTKAELELNYRTRADTDSAIALAVSALGSSVASAGYVTSAVLTNTYFTISQTNSRIQEEITSLDQSLGGLITAVDARVDSSFQDIAAEATSRAFAITQLEATLRGDLVGQADVDASITAYNSVLVSPTGAIAQQVDALEATLRIDLGGSGEGGVTASQVDAKIDAYNLVLVSPTGAIAQQVNTLETSLRTDLALKTELTAAINNYNATLLAANGPLATQLEGLDTALSAQIAIVDGKADQALQDVIAEATARASSLQTLEVSLRNDLATNTFVTSSISTFRDTLISPTGAIAQQVNSLNVALRSDLGVDISAAATTASDAFALANGNVGAIQNINIVANGAAGDAGAALQLASLAGADITSLKANAQLVATVNAEGRAVISGVKANSTASTSKLDLIGDVIRFVKSNGDVALTYDLANDVYTFTGALRGEAVEIVGAQTMEIKRPNPFGPDNLLHWDGPVNSTTYDSVTDTVLYANLTKANATTFWKDFVGNAYFGGSLSAGAISEGTRSFSITLNPSVLLGPFGTNQGSKQVSISFSWDAERRTNTVGVAGTQTKAAGTMRVRRRINSGSWVFVGNIFALNTNLVTTVITDNDPTIPDLTIATETGGGGGTFTDTSTVAGLFEYELIVSNQDRWLNQNEISSQILSINSVEA